MMDCRFEWLAEVESAVYANDKGEIRSKANSLAMKKLRKVKIPLRKILLSATLSQDPEKLQQWNLFQPKLFAAAKTSQSTPGNVTSLTIPAELEQYQLTCEASVKPLNLHIVLQSHVEDWKKVLCFVGSKENGKRLVGILKLMKSSGIVAEIDANLIRGRREKVLKKFAQSKIRVLVCSDLVARGMDLSDVDCVISYNAPKFLKTYVHRVGRTARAGRPGCALTILEENELQVERFRGLISPVCDWSAVEKLEVSKEKIKELRAEYKMALKELKNIIQDERKTKGHKKKI